MPTALVFPYLNRLNRYIEIHKTILKESGYDVQPLSIKSLFLAGRWRELWRQDTILTFHWMEHKPFHPNGNSVGWSARGWLEWIFYFTVVSFCPARAVYFVHDHAVHDTTGFKQFVSRFLLKTMSRAASLRVVHDPSFCTQYKAVYLPHPLYWTFPETNAPAIGPVERSRKNPSEIVFGLIGVMRPYKRIDGVLNVWPKDKQLLIKGHAQPDYATYLRSLIETRGLAQSVSLQPHSMSQEELDQTFNTIDVLLLPHQAGSALVSGAFFEGIGRVPVIIARASPFILWAAQQIPGILAFHNDDEIPSLLEQAKQLVNQLEPAAHRQVAIAAFGSDHCFREYSAAMQSLKCELPQ